MPAGRPTKMTKATIQNLEDAFKWGCTDLEACLNADISKSTLYNYQEANPKFLERKERLKENPILLARKSVVDSMASKPNIAMEYLTKKKSDEFAEKIKTESTVKHGLTPEVLDKINEIIG